MLGVDLCRELRGRYAVWEADLVGLGTNKKFRRCDITDRKSVRAAMRKARPDAVILTAAWTDVDGCELDPKRAHRVNADGPRNVALACRFAGIPLVFISTDFIFSGKKRTPYKESDRPAPLGVYGDSKLRGETAVRKTLKEHVIVRTSWLYGKHGKNFVDTIIAKGRSEPLLRVVDEQVGSPTYTVDLAGALGALLDRCFAGRGRWGTYHVSNGGSVSWYGYARAILRLKGLKAIVEPITAKELGRPARRPAMSALDNGKFRRYMGFALRGWKDALKAYIRSA